MPDDKAPVVSHGSGRTRLVGAEVVLNHGFTGCPSNRFRSVLIAEDLPKRVREVYGTGIGIDYQRPADCFVSGAFYALAFFGNWSKVLPFFGCQVITEKVTGGPR